MTDISMCGNSGACLVKNTCYRHIAKAQGQHQSYMAFEPSKGKECSGYWSALSETYKKFEVVKKHE